MATKFENAGLTACKVLEVLLSGKDVTKEEFRPVLGANLYRLSTYIWRIGKFLGAETVAIRNGKTVSGYRLVNPDKFKDFVVPVKAPKVAKPAKVKVAKPVRAPKVKPVRAPKVKPVTVTAKAASKKPAKKVNKVVEDLGENMPLSMASVDGDFDAVDPMEIPNFLK